MDMDEENDDIAAAMGFSSFGGAKKRKFEQASSPSTKDSASGANSTQLGIRNKDVPKESTNPDLHSSPTSRPAKQAATGLAEFLARAKTLPDRPPQAQEPPSTTNHGDPHGEQTVSFGGEPITRAELNALRFGVNNEHGDTAYFLPSFVEDPWMNLKRSRE